MINKNDTSYIIRRVIAGVLVFLAIYFLKGLLLMDVFALGVTSHNVGGEDVVIDNTTLEVSHTVSDNPWSNWRYGYLYFDFSINKVNGTSTSSLVFPRSATACSDTVCYLCSIGSSSTNNATYDSSVFSAKCPMDMGASGLTSVKIQFNDFQNNNPSQYRFRMGGLMTFEQISETSIDISSINQQTQQQMANDNQNTQDIIDNQNQNTEDIIESNQVCSFIDKVAIIDDGKYLIADGYTSNNSQFGITDYISIRRGDILKVIGTRSGQAQTCFYNVNKSVISCVTSGDMVSNSVLTIPNNTAYFRASINKSENLPTFNLCRNGNQAIADSQQEINNTLNNDSVDMNGKSDFFTGFTESNPLANVVLFPVHLLQSSMDSCSPITITLYNQNIVLPCGDTIFWNKSEVSSFRTWWNLFVGGLALYYLSVKFWHILNDSMDPFKDSLNGIGGF